MNNETFVRLMNGQLVGQHGVVMLTGNNRPKYVGTFESVKISGMNLLLKFSKHLVLLCMPISVFSIVEKTDKEDNYLNKEICDDLFIGDKSFQEIATDITTSENMEP